MINVPNFDFKNPDYKSIIEKRIEFLNKIKSKPDLIPQLKHFYKNNIAQFIVDWGHTYDPRNPEVGLIASIPFILFDKQTEWVDWLVDHWKNRKSGLVEKTRTVGMSWLSIAVACSLCIFHEGLTIGFGSRKQDYVDKIGDIDSLLEKARFFINNLPPFFRGGFDVKSTSKLMLLSFPDSTSHIKGESGDGIGRGGRSSIYFVDEAAFLERPNLIDASLSENTNCRIDISTPNGFDNSFAQKRHSGKIDVFTFHWRSDPRRDDIWYEKKCREINNSVIIAQELDINYSASKDYIVIPSEWIQAAIDSHLKLNIQISGIKQAALDVADTGKDTNAICGRHGILIEHIEEWSGNNSDIFETTKRAFNICDSNNYKNLIYDGDGLGAGVRGDSNELNSNRFHKINVNVFRAAGEVARPDNKNSQGRTNKDTFTNAKAQAWWNLRERFEKTYQTVFQGIDNDHDDLISISSNLKLLNKLIQELTYPTWSLNNAGKIKIDKSPDGIASPNLADAVMMCFAENKKPQLNISNERFTLKR